MRPATWFDEAATTHTTEAATDYLRYERHLNAIGSRCHWRLVLEQGVIGRDLDPYNYRNRSGGGAGVSGRRAAGQPPDPVAGSGRVRISRASEASGWTNITLRGNLAVP